MWMFSMWLIYYNPWLANIIREGWKKDKTTRKLDRLLGLRLNSTSLFNQVDCMACCYLRRDTEPVVFFLSFLFLYLLYVFLFQERRSTNFTKTYINPTLYLLIPEKICSVCQTIYRIFYLSYNTLTKHIGRRCPTDACFWKIKIETVSKVRHQLLW